MKAVARLRPRTAEERGLPELPGPKDTGGENLDLAAGSWWPVGT